jgi:hypothetical protein
MERGFGGFASDFGFLRLGPTLVQLTLANRAVRRRRCVVAVSRCGIHGGMFLCCFVCCFFVVDVCFFFFEKAANRLGSVWDTGSPTCLLMAGTIASYVSKVD